MPFYETAYRGGAYLHIDTDGDRVLLLAGDFYGDPSDAHAEDEGVIAIYPIDERLSFRSILIALDDAGFDMDGLPIRAEDETAPLSALRPPALRLADQSDGEE